MVLECSSSGNRVSKSLFSATLSEIRAQISTGIIFTHQTGGLITAETNIDGVTLDYYGEMMPRRAFSC